MNITVYCGASLGNDSAYQTAAEKLGKWIADGQHTLVYGGRKLGLMDSEQINREKEETYEY